MIKTRIASTAALFTFGLAALGGTVVAIAAPANTESQSPADKVAAGQPLRKVALDAMPVSTVDKLRVRTTSPNAGPISKVGSAPTSSVSSTGGAQTSSASMATPSSLGASDAEAARSEDITNLQQQQQQAIDRQNGRAVIITGDFNER